MRTPCTVIADGTLLNPDGQALLCTVANGKFVGSAFQCAPRAKTDDGLMEVCLVKPVSRLRFLRVKKYYERGEHLDIDCMKDMIVYKRAKKVEIIAPEGFCYTVDGELIYDTHLTVEILPGVLNFVCPT